MDDKFKYGEQLRLLRKKSGLSQEEVALEADITPAYYGQIERGAANPTVGMLEKICAVLGISIVDIFIENPNGQTDTDTDPLIGQILYRLAGKSDREKELILSMIKSAFKLQAEHKNSRRA